MRHLLCIESIVVRRGGVVRGVSRAMNHSTSNQPRDSSVHRDRAAALGVARPEPHDAPWRRHLHTIIFEADTLAGRTFDITLIACILASVIVVLLDSVSSVRADYHGVLYVFEWIFTIIFTVEYVLRLLAVRRPASYAKSFFGVVDFLSIAPTWISLLLPGAEYLMTFRIVRLLRIFRILKLTEYVAEASVITGALRASRRKILVFIFAILTLVVILGSMMYVIEGEKHGFADIPTSIYWAIVTMTTVGYGDLAPATPLGKLLACIVMLTGYAIIAVPTGIVTAEFTARRNAVSTQACPNCGSEGHEVDAKFCRNCGSAM